MKSLIYRRKHAAVLLTQTKVIICRSHECFSNSRFGLRFWWKVRKRRRPPRDRHDLAVRLHPRVRIQEMLRDNISRLEGLGPLKRPFEHEKPGRSGDRFHGRLPPPSGNVEHLPHHRAHLGDLSGSGQPKRSRQCSSSSTRAKYDTLSMTHTLPVTVCVCLPSRPAANWQIFSSLL